MDRRERSADNEAAMLVMLTGFQATIWTAMPGVIISFDPAKKTCAIQPAIRAKITLADGTFQWVSLPTLVDCPVQFPSGGGVTLTFPIKVGDECLVVFASRCIDAWWQSGCPVDVNGQITTQVQAELRMHDLSDGFCIPGVSSVPNVPVNISTTQAELRSTDGQVVIGLNPTSKAVSIATPGSVTVQSGANVSLNASAANFKIAGPFSVSAPTVSYDGAVNVAGKLRAGSAQVSGPMNVGGSMTVGGSFGGSGFSIGSTGANFGTAGATTGALTVGGLAALTLKSTGGFRLPGGSADAGTTGVLSAAVYGWGAGNAQALIGGLGSVYIDNYCAAGTFASLMGGGATVSAAQVETGLRALLSAVSLAIGDIKNTHII